MAVRENVSHMGKLAAPQHFEFSRGGLALDALHLLARDVDCAGELVGLEHPAFHHILNRRTSEAELLGRFALASTWVGETARAPQRAASMAQDERGPCPEG